MKFITFNTETVASRSSSTKPRITFSKGASTINSVATELLKIKDGDTISIHQEDEENNDFFISVGDPSGFKLRKTKDEKYPTLGFNCSALAKGIMKALSKEEDNSISFQIIPDPQPQDVTWSKKKVNFYLLCHLQKSV